MSKSSQNPFASAFIPVDIIFSDVHPLASRYCRDTGSSGKNKSFLQPITSRCLRLESCLMLIGISDKLVPSR
ncbi:hypothetical protein TorRG33x02_355810 [Trema orientale]|uniref:Uncharacterized protein n=1 Tax=Trema orientale TaxID=63057 RepID=A0A2P5A8Q5_TREOI|nr:hypothetical protein TorRG33x02_355810 [Trema orientale]